MKRSMKLISAATLALLLLGGCGQNNVPMEEARVELGAYKGLTVTAEKAEVLEEDIQSYAFDVVEEYNQNLASERTVVEEGDIVDTIIYFYDAEENVLGGIDAPEHRIHLGSGEIYPEIESVLIGAEVGSKVIADVTLQAPYETEESLQGAAARAEVTVRGIREADPISLDTLTDEQVQLVSDADSVDAFYEEIRTELETSAELYGSRNAYEALCEELLKTCKVKPFPGQELKERMAESVSSVEEMAKVYYEMTFEEYCNMMGMTEKEYRQMLKEDLTDAIKLELILSAIIKAENIVPDDEGYRAYVKRCLSDYGYDSEELLYADYGEDAIKDAYQTELATKWLLENNEIKFVKPE